MPVIMREVSVAAGARDPNLFAGSTYEIARGNVVFSIGVTAAATGTFVTISSGADIVAEEFAPPVLTRYPIIPDEFYFSELVDPGDRMVFRAQNNTGAGIFVRYVVQLSGRG